MQDCMLGFGMMETRRPLLCASIRTKHQASTQLVLDVIQHMQQSSPWLVESYVSNIYQL